MKALYEAFEELEAAVKLASDSGSLFNYAKLSEALQAATRLGQFDDEYQTITAYHEFLASKVSA